MANIIISVIVSSDLCGGLKMEEIKDLNKLDLVIQNHIEELSCEL